MVFEKYSMTTAVLLPTSTRPLQIVSNINPDKQIQFDYSLHQQRLEQVQSARYLEITITDNLDLSQHISKFLSKA